jgi:hypothetical protein
VSWVASEKLLEYLTTHNHHIRLQKGIHKTTLQTKSQAFSGIGQKPCESEYFEIRNTE